MRSIYSIDGCITDAHRRRLFNDFDEMNVLLSFKPNNNSFDERCGCSRNFQAFTAFNQRIPYSMDKVDQSYAISALQHILIRMPFLQYCRLQELNLKWNLITDSCKLIA